MRNDKMLAYKMRVQGKSYAEIAEGLGMSKSTLSSWFRHLELPAETKEKIRQRSRAASMNALFKINHERTQKAEERSTVSRASSRHYIGKLSHRDLLLIGATLYWTDGYKSPIIHKGKARTYHPVSFTSTDPQKTALFVRFLQEVCKVHEEHISADIRRRDTKQDPQLLQFWSKTTGLPYSRFKKSYQSKSGPPYGTIQIRVNNTPLFHKIMGWIEGLGNS